MCVGSPLRRGSAGGKEGSRTVTSHGEGRMCRGPAGSVCGELGGGLLQPSRTLRVTGSHSRALILPRLWLQQGTEQPSAAVHTCRLTQRDAPEEPHPETAWGQGHWILFVRVSLPGALGLVTVTSAWRQSDRSRLSERATQSTTLSLVPVKLCSTRRTPQMGGNQSSL